jgi:hypothetical protein
VCIKDMCFVCLRLNVNVFQVLCHAYPRFRLTKPIFCHFFKKQIFVMLTLVFVCSICCVCKRERESEREGGREREVGATERARESVCVCVCMCVSKVRIDALKVNPNSWPVSRSHR